ncbi:MAG: chemotaxis protein CheW [Gammaproteobacteria bacterium]
MSTEQPQAAPPAVQHGGETSQYLTFILADEEYGVDILRVQEIKGWDSATPIPNTPEYIRGVINLRGTIVPIVDLRRRFALESVDFGNTTVVVVLKVRNEQGERTMGFVVDSVSDVYTVPTEQVRPAPDLGVARAAACVKGLATLDGKMLILLDIDRLVDADMIGESAATH